MKIDPNNKNHLFADEGKVLYRKYDGSGPFLEVLLGRYRYGYIMKNEIASDFEERDAENNEKEN